MGSDKVYSKIDRIPRGTASENIIDGCLVLEGGAFRGLYTQGLLDYWMRHGINFQTMIGVSAGALSAVAYMSRQIGRSARANLGYRHDSRYIGVKAIRKSHSLINLNFLIYDLNKIEPLDVERFNDPRRRLIAVATNCETGETEYFERGKCSDIYEALKASASMPYISPMVEVDGKKCLDGGCSCAIPYQWAIDQGFEKIVIVKTHDRTFRNADPKEGTTAHRVYLKHQEFAKVLDHSDVRYNEDYDNIDILRDRGRAFVIEPSEVVTVSRVEGDMEKLGELYWLGYNDGAKTLDALIKYLGLNKSDYCPSVRLANVDDAEKLLDIYAPYVEKTAITFDYKVPTVDEFKQRIQAISSRYPYIVAELQGQIVGYAYAGVFKDRAAYDWSVETTIYVKEGFHGMGIGQMLYEDLERRLKEQGIRNLYACVAYTEEPDEYLTNQSVLFHERLGFEICGRFHRCGFKFDRWYDMVWMEKILTGGEDEEGL